MTTTSSRMAWAPLLVAVALGAAGAGITGWQLNLQSVDREITRQRSTLKKLALTGGVPPNQEVSDYLNRRQASLEERYRVQLKRIVTPPPDEAVKADPQVYFQEQFHEVQRTIERLATARGATVPEQLGFPKDLPPSDTVPRLMIQLSLMREVASLVLEQGIMALSSLKIEDPELVPEEYGGGPFLMRLPVRATFSASLSELMKVLAALERAEPLIEVRGLRLLTGTDSGRLDVELSLCRYLVMAAQATSLPAEEQRSSTEPESTSRRPTARKGKGVQTDKAGSTDSKKPTARRTPRAAVESEDHSKQ